MYKNNNATAYKYSGGNQSFKAKNKLKISTLWNNQVLEIES